MVSKNIFSLFFIGKNRHGIGENVAILIWIGAEIRPLVERQKIPCKIARINLSMFSYNFILKQYFVKKKIIVCARPWSDRLLLQEQADLGLHCIVRPFCLYLG